MMQAATTSLARLGRQQRAWGTQGSRLAAEARRARVAHYSPAAATEAAATTSSSAAPPLPNWKPGASIRMLYDGECSLCMKEVNFLRKRDAGKGRIDFVDIADPGYSAAANAGISYQAAMERIHAIRADGSIVRDIEVFRLLYEAVDLGWVYGLFKNESALNLGNKVYALWAKYRTQITGREALGVILARHAAGSTAGSLCKDGVDGACELPAPGEGGSKAS